MILPFSTKINGKPTYFVEKIQTALRLPYFKNSVAFSPDHVPPNMDFYVKSYCKPKIHSIREDEKNRWKVGTKIDFFINCRQKDMFRFAPQVPVVEIQEVFMTYYSNDIIEISVDGNYINNIVQFAINDGFDCWIDFFNYFYPKIESNKDKFFKGKLIHWTDKRY